MLQPKSATSHKNLYPVHCSLCLKAYTEPTASYLHGQAVYPGHQQGVVVQQGGTVTTIVTSQTVQQVADLLHSVFQTHQANEIMF